MFRKMLSNFSKILAISSIPTSVLAASDFISINDQAPGWASWSVKMAAPLFRSALPLTT